MSDQEYGYVAVLELNGQILIHKKIDETHADPKVLDKAELKSFVLMIQRDSVEQCVESVKTNIKELDELLKRFKIGEINNETKGTREPITIGSFSDATENS